KGKLREIRNNVEDSKLSSLMYKFESLWITADKRFKTVLVRRQPIANFPVYNNYELHPVLSNPIHEDLGIPQGREPHHSPSTVVIEQVELPRNPHRRTGSMSTNPLRRLDIGVGPLFCHIEVEVVSTDPQLLD